MSAVNELTENEFILVLNTFWHFYKQHANDYPKQFKHYLSGSKFYNRIVYVSRSDSWTLLKQLRPELPNISLIKN